MLCEEAFTGGSGRADWRGFSLSEQRRAVRDESLGYSLTLCWLQEMAVHMPCPPLTRHLGWHSWPRCP